MEGLWKKLVELKFQRIKRKLKIILINLMMGNQIIIQMNLVSLRASKNQKQPKLLKINLLKLRGKKNERWLLRDTLKLLPEWLCPSGLPFFWKGAEIVSRGHHQTIVKGALPFWTPPFSLSRKEERWYPGGHPAVRLRRTAKGSSSGEPPRPVSFG